MTKSFYVYLFNVTYICDSFIKILEAIALNLVQKTGTFQMERDDK
ncbi:hypothetical protein SAMN02927921_02159 [Sinomicrobium oceani]|uniref:Uncharacterized protein n=1 Tax=Sinomicrobium oceani TaxID=1150368 RepID=A0A1K1Q119_9FLAO|nr:hypothetical protein SAMN02927921_02159 [Sinomicrobium oceani]